MSTAYIFNIRGDDDKAILHNASFYELELLSIIPLRSAIAG